MVKNKAFTLKTLLAAAVALVLMLFCTSLAFASAVTLEYAVVNGSTYPLDGEAEMTIASPFSGGSRPTVTLQFANNVSATGVIYDNMPLISLYDENEDVVLSTVTATDNSRELVIRPSVLLSEGGYHIVISPGIKANNGNISTAAYNIKFNVGAPVAAPDDGTPKSLVTFNVSGAGESTSFVLIANKGSGYEYMAKEDGTVELPNGEYSYVVSATARVTALGSFTVSGAAQTIPVELKDKIAFTFNVTPADAAIQVKDSANNAIQPSSGTTYMLTPSFEYTYVLSKPGYVIQSSRLNRIEDGVFRYELQVDADYNPSSYGFQGAGGQRLQMLTPSSVNIIADDPYYNNEIGDAFTSAAAINFVFTLEAGMNNFDEERFKSTHINYIKVYADYNQSGPVGAVLAEYAEGSGKLKFVSYADKKITVGLDAGALSEGSYALVFSKDLPGNNTSKTLGKDIAFRFKVNKAASDPGTSDPGTSNPGASNPGTSDGTTSGFSDVRTGAWYANAAAAVVEKGLFSLTAEGEFFPDMTMTRAMFVTVLGRFDGGVGKAASAGFTDVRAADYYAPYANWAAENGLASGFVDNTFGGAQPVSRQQAIMFLYRYAGFKGYDIGYVDAGKLDSFTDASAVYDRSAINWAINTGLLGGKTATTLNPNDKLTRAETAEMFKRFMDMFRK